MLGLHGRGLKIGTNASLLLAVQGIRVWRVVDTVRIGVGRAKGFGIRTRLHQTHAKQVHVQYGADQLE